MGEAPFWSWRQRGSRNDQRLPAGSRRLRNSLPFGGRTSTPVGTRFCRTALRLHPLHAPLQPIVVERVRPESASSLLQRARNIDIANKDSLQRASFKTNWWIVLWLVRWHPFNGSGRQRPFARVARPW